MMIDKISGINPLNEVQSTKRTSSAENVKSSPDSIDVSDEAKAMSDAYYLDKVAEETPDVRQDLIDQIKQKIQDPNYLSEAVISDTADKLLTSYGL